MKFLLYTVLTVLFIGTFTSCVSRERIVYFQDIEKLASQNNLSENNTKIKPNDLLSITVSSIDLDAVRPFNLGMGNGSSASGTTGATSQAGYLVDSEGNIEFPVLGTVHAAGLNRKQLNDILKEKVSAYVKNSIITIRILNFNITILGEVKAPGTYAIKGERITLPEAIGLAGDLTLFGRRDNILIIREVEGKREYKFVDIRKIDVMDTDYYYLQQNDVVYVEPNKAQIQGSSVNKNTSLYFSIASLLLTIAILVTR